MDSKASKEQRQRFLQSFVEQARISQDDLAEYLGSIRSNGLEIEAWTLEELKEKTKEYLQLPGMLNLERSYEQTMVQGLPHREIRIKNLDQGVNVLRHVNEIYWVFDRLSDEQPHIAFMKPPPLDKLFEKNSDDFKPEVLEKVGFSIAHLMTLRRLIRSQTLETFLKSTIEDWRQFVQKSRVKKTDFELSFSSFSFSNVSANPKVLPSEYLQHNSFKEPPGPSLKAIQEFLSSSAGSWGKIDDIFQRLPKAFGTLSDLLLSLGKAFEELYLQIQTQNSKLNKPEDPLGELTKSTKEFFTCWSETIKKQASSVVPSIQIFVESFRKRTLTLSNV